MDTNLETQTFEFHPLAEAFPLMRGSEFDALVESIRGQGLLEPLTLHPDGRVLDGRNRYRACQKAGIPIRIMTYEGRDAAGFVVAKNVARRQLNKSQLGLAAAKMVTAAQGGNGSNQHKRAKGDGLTLCSSQEREDDFTRERAAQLCGISVDQVMRARTVLRASGEKIGDAERACIKLSRPNQEKLADIVTEIMHGKETLDTAYLFAKKYNIGEKPQRKLKAESPPELSPAPASTFMYPAAPMKKDDFKELPLSEYGPVERYGKVQIQPPHVVDRNRRERVAQELIKALRPVEEHMKKALDIIENGFDICPLPETIIYTIESPEQFADEISNVWKKAFVQRYDFLKGSLGKLEAYRQACS